MPKVPLEGFQDKILEKVREDIAREGWATIAVMSAADNASPAPNFAYSIGFQEHDHPEVIVLGLPTHQMHEIIAGLYKRVSEGARFDDGCVDSETLEGYDVIFRACPPDGKPLNVARAYYQNDELPAVQLLWPDEEGHYPGDEECHPLIVEAQDLQRIVMRLELGGSFEPTEETQAKLDGPDELFERFQAWTREEPLFDMDRFWDDFDITADAVKNFAINSASVLNISPPVIAVLMTFGAKLASERYRPKGRPGITL